MNQDTFLDRVRDNQGIIYKLVGLYATGPEEKKDLCQEILFQAWKAWPSFRGEARFSTWLYRVSLNTILTQKRKVQPVEYKDSMAEWETAVPSEGEDARHLRCSIRRLRETDRAIITLHLDGYSNGEIAGIMGISNNGVAVKLHRIKQQLADIIKQ